ncbi:NUDIX hydrolase [Thermicanus aegyptius]|uniref:NUDIX hydrolase n=1 Tax=Thermicanus aegyptius TaxID=94009 RepID=UPI00040BF74C|nr:8-oxo-dGTP diphosphatase [Thermicanus aegyptius]
MQRVSNCLILDGKGNDERILMLEKPRRGWWYPPGGKMDEGETILETAVREAEEETSLTLVRPQLRGVFTIRIEENSIPINEWMLFTFLAREWRGEVRQGTHEGTLRWIEREKVSTLPMPEGDRIILQKVLSEKGMWIGRFVYTPDYELIRYDLQQG